MISVCINILDLITNIRFCYNLKGGLSFPITHSIVTKNEFYKTNR